MTILSYRYEGEWVDDMMTGRGFMIWADGRRYDGEWLENRCNGRGVLTYKNGRRYEVVCMHRILLIDLPFNMYIIEFKLPLCTLNQYCDD